MVREAQLSDAQEIARVQVDSWKATYRGIVSDDFLKNMSYEERGNRWKHTLSTRETKSFTLVVENASGEIVGFASGGPTRETNDTYQGELYAIYILQHEQRKGLGTQLVQTVVEQLERLRLYSLLVWVLKDNPSRHFYEALGGKFVTERPIKIGAQTLDEVAYGWKDIRVLKP